MARKGKLFSVDTKPTKEVVVKSLTRDATVEACIFDLIDNSIDAARERLSASSKDSQEETLPSDYSGYAIALQFSSDGFKIADNCGGISVENLKRLVLRFGQRSEQAMGIGVFGVGLNRALFRLGRTSHLETDNGNRRSILILNVDNYLKEDGWDLPAEEFPSSGKIGTTIEIKNLHGAIAKDFADTDWIRELGKEIGQRYGRFISKKLEISVNEVQIIDQTVAIRENSPYQGEYKFYKTDNDVAIHIQYGQHRDHRFKSEQDYDQDRNRLLTKQYGWTIFCNDRAILISDQTFKTGWDTKFHSEFYGFVGVVNFVGEADKLPWTTTKTDVDLNNNAYQSALTDMRRFAEKWRTLAGRRKKEPARPIPPKAESTKMETIGAPPPPSTRKGPSKAKPSIATPPVKKADHNEIRQILPQDIDEKHCYDKHLALVHEAKELDLGDFNYAGLAVMRMLFEASVLTYMIRHGKMDDLRDSAIAKRRSKGLAILPEEEKKVMPTPDEMVAFLENNYAVWGATKATHLKHSLKRLAGHKPMMNSAIHNPLELINRAKTFQIRDEILPILRHLIET